MEIKSGVDVHLAIHGGPRTEASAYILKEAVTLWTDCDERNPHWIKFLTGLVAPGRSHMETVCS